MLNKYSSLMKKRMSFPFAHTANRLLLGAKAGIVHPDGLQLPTDFDCSSIFPDPDAEYLKTILPEYREHPEIVIQNIHRDAVVHVLGKADKKIMIQPTEGDGGREIRIELDSE